MTGLTSMWSRADYVCFGRKCVRQYSDVHACYFGLGQ